MSGRLRENFKTVFHQETKRFFRKWSVNRSGGLKEWSLREICLYFKAILTDVILQHDHRMPRMASAAVSAFFSSTSFYLPSILTSS